MKRLYQFSARCEICGELAYGSSPASWTEKYEHRDKAICAENLRIQKEKLHSSSLASWSELNMTGRP